MAEKHSSIASPRRARAWLRSILLGSTLILADSSLSPGALAAASQAHFPEPPIIRSKVRFWERVFSQTSTQTTLLHDSEYPGKIIDVIDFTALSKRAGLKNPPNAKRRSQIADKYLKRYQLAVTRFAQFGKNALKHGPIEERLYQVYLNHPVLLARLMKGQVKLRLQPGLKEEFLRATGRAAKYLPFIEATFAKHGVPIPLSRLAFVESMFNTEALSKVGASGIWQFMPSTARRYLNVDRLVDERSNPFKASIAAARLLRDNYDLLGSWPLAVTAYNHGTAGMQKAVRSLRTKDIDHLVKHYKSPSFGFASRNFYAEFLAVNRVYEHWRKEGIAQKPKPSNILPILVRHGLTLDQFVGHAAVPKHVLFEYNPDISSRAFSSLKYKKLPPNFKVYLPQLHALRAKNAMMALYNTDPASKEVEF